MCDSTRAQLMYAGVSSTVYIQIYHIILHYVSYSIGVGVKGCLSTQTWP